MILSDAEGDIGNDVLDRDQVIYDYITINIKGSLFRTRMKGFLGKLPILLVVILR